MGRRVIVIGLRCKWAAVVASEKKSRKGQSGSQCYWCEEKMLGIKVPVGSPDLTSR